jgi:hypothetical protein
MYGGQPAQLLLREDDQRKPYGADVLVSDPDGSVKLLAQSNGYPQPATGSHSADFSDPASWYTFAPPITYVPSNLAIGSTFAGSYTTRLGGSGDFHGRVMSQNSATFAGVALPLVHLSLRWSERQGDITVIHDYSDMAWAPSLHMFVTTHMSFTHAIAGQTAESFTVSQRLLALSPL